MYAIYDWIVWKFENQKFLIESFKFCVIYRVVFIKRTCLGIYFMFDNKKLSLNCYFYLFLPNTVKPALRPPAFNPSKIYPIRLFEPLYKDQVHPVEVIFNGSL